MPRAKVIFVVEASRDHTPAGVGGPLLTAAFTVKHELRSWWQSLTYEDRRVLGVWRIQDGVHRGFPERRRVMPEELEE